MQREKKEKKINESAYQKQKSNKQPQKSANKKSKKQKLLFSGVFIEDNHLKDLTLQLDALKPEELPRQHIAGLKQSLEKKSGKDGSGWQEVHMTSKFNPDQKHVNDNQSLFDQTFDLTITGYAYQAGVGAALIVELPPSVKSVNTHPHITLYVEGEGKPQDLNTVLSNPENRTTFSKPFTVTGKWGCSSKGKLVHTHKEAESFFETQKAEVSVKNVQGPKEEKNDSQREAAPLPIDLAANKSGKSETALLAQSLERNVFNPAVVNHQLKNPFQDETPKSEPHEAQKNEEAWVWV